MDAWLVLCLLVFNLALMSGQAPPPPPPPPKYPGYPPVEGPKSLNDKIAIIGLTAEGIDMYARLKELGFTYVRIFTKNRYLEPEGVETYYHRDKTTYKPYELGESVIMKYYKHFKEFNDKYAQVPLQPYEEAKVRSTLAGKSSNVRQWLFDYLSDLFKSRMNITLTQEMVDKNIPNKFEHYKRKRKELFGDYESNVPPKLPKDALTSLNISFKQYLNSNQMGVLNLFFRYVLATLGVTDLENMPAIYGFMILTNPVVDMMKEYILNNITTLYEVPEKGMEHLFREAMKRAVDFDDVKEKHDPYAIKRDMLQKKCYVYYEVEEPETGKKKKKKRSFDFCIVTTDLKSFSFRDKSNLERELFGSQGALDRLYEFKFLLKLQKSGALLPQGLMFYWWNDRINVPSEITHCDTRDYMSPEKKLEIEDTVQLAVCSLFTANRSSDVAQVDIANITAQMDMSLDLFNFYIAFRRRYLATRFDAVSMANGAYQRILQEQGKNLVWYMGRSATCPSVECGLAYNDLIWESYTKPPKVPAPPVPPAMPLQPAPPQAPVVVG